MGEAVAPRAGGVVLGVFRFVLEDPRRFACTYIHMTVPFLHHTHSDSPLCPMPFPGSI